ncbi:MULTISPECIES: acetate/propionate family kinase [unclassified Mycoplasma]|uniref:acetate/propionate family kinase n=1 Tax=unclassified Mycoplasma TaxID=2683645 RepID=UPI00211C3A23|nr:MULTISPECIES: acetate/propionate family kinase [unclassified Mycoplasma]UUM19925.1 acetate/propionate family kinase [Mycoplasma sp. 1578d]UUM24906.1 acetate/propionate family kinase [Mycoplasma sp. 3686d]
MNKILVINAGSSSIKMSLFEKDTLNVIATGLAERITLPQGNITIKTDQKHEKEVSMPNHEVAVEEVYKLMHEINLIKDKNEIEYIGFRVVQGGEFFSKSSKIDDKAIEIIDHCSMYAPLHNPGAVQAMNGFKKVFPNAKLSANFDTAFHTTIDKVNSTYPIPKTLTEQYKIKRYGAHGISHRFITLKLQEILNKDKVTFINLHIGNGASLCAVKDSQSFDTSMGLTPLAGIMMGTRSGDIDPSIHEFVMKQNKMSISEFTNMLNKESGLLGVSGISSDMRDVTEKASQGNQDAQFAIDLYTQKIADYTSIYFNKLGGKIDALVFTAGIGENSALIREKVLSKLHFRNISLDKEINQGKIGEYQLITTPQSEVPVYVIRTNEELLIAQDALKLYEN